MSNYLILYLILTLIFFTNNIKGQGQRQDQGQYIPCNMVVQQLSPCLAFLDKQVTSPSENCCQGAKGTYNMYGKNKKNRQAVCQCLESMLPYVGGTVDEALVSALPKQCGLKIKLPPVTNSSFNCSQVS